MMKYGQLLAMTMCIGSFLVCMESNSSDLVYAQEQRYNVKEQSEPSPHYAKWGRQAMQITHENFPQASIQDYLYVGGFPQKSGLTDEVFRLVVSKDGNLQTVIVILTVQTGSQLLQGSTIQKLETSPYKDVSDQIVRQRH